MFVLKNKRMRFSLCRLGRTPGVGLGVAWGQFFSQTWSCGMKGMISRTGYKLNFHRMVKLVIARYKVGNRPVNMHIDQTSGHYWF